ncbi:hypothetical protein SEA_PAELLA_203 [Arthrobacter phage Paella]|nr:hypothetical protein SEA_PAELLA_203 [Arthrobacter phage Paella]
MTTRVLVPLMFVTLGIILLCSWIQLTLSPLIRFGMDAAGTFGGLAGMGASIGTGLWLFKLYLEYMVKKLIDLGWRKTAE